MKKLFVIALFSVFICPVASAATVFAEGKVLSIKMFSDIAVIFVEGLTNACTTGQARVAIQKDDPIFSIVVSTALTAKATDAIVQIGHHQSCINQNSSWDFESLWLR